MATETIQKRPAVFVKVSALRPDTTGHNLKLKVVDAKVVLNRGSASGSSNNPSKISECTVGDETGVVVLTARNEQVDLVKPGNSIVVRNAKVDMFRGSMRLGVNQWGKLEESQEEFDFKPEVENNLSLIEYELVPVPAQPQQANGVTA